METFFKPDGAPHEAPTEATRCDWCNGRINIHVYHAFIGKVFCSTACKECFAERDIFRIGNEIDNHIINGIAGEKLNEGVLVKFVEKPFTFMGLEIPFTNVYGTY